MNLALYICYICYICTCESDKSLMEIQFASWFIRLIFSGDSLSQFSWFARAYSNQRFGFTVQECNWVVSNNSFLLLILHHFHNKLFLQIFSSIFPFIWYTRHTLLLMSWTSKPMRFVNKMFCLQLKKGDSLTGWRAGRSVSDSVPQVVHAPAKLDRTVDIKQGFST